MEQPDEGTAAKPWVIYSQSRGNFSQRNLHKATVDSGLKKGHMSPVLHSYNIIYRSV